MRPRTTVFSLVQFNLFAQEAFELMMAKRITAISYELMADEYNRFPVLNVTSEIEGAASITIASELLSNTQGGKGILLGGIPGVSPYGSGDYRGRKRRDRGRACRVGLGSIRESIR